MKILRRILKRKVKTTSEDKTIMSTTLENETESKKTINKVWDRRAFLKIKIKSLAAEAKLIRQEEKRNGRLSIELRAHRIGIVRDEARATQLAYAFIRGRSYKAVESSYRQGHAPNWLRVEAMVNKYGKAYDPNLPPMENHRNGDALMKRLKTWMTE